MLTRIGDEVVEYPVYRDELGITAYGGDKGQNYTLTMPGGDKMELLFQNGNGPIGSINGLSNEIIIAVLIDRLSILNNRAPCKQNLRAMAHLEDALANLESRSLHRGRMQISPLGTTIG